MIRQLRKVGDCNVLIIDESIMELLGLEEEGQVQLTIQDGALIVLPVFPEAVDVENVLKQLDHVVDTRAAMLKRLAD